MLKVKATYKTKHWFITFDCPKIAAWWITKRQKDIDAKDVVYTIVDTRKEA